MKRVISFAALLLCAALLCGCSAKEPLFVGWFLTDAWIGSLDFSGVTWEGENITLADDTEETLALTARDGVAFRFGDYGGMSLFFSGTPTASCAVYGASFSDTAADITEQNGTVCAALSGTLTQPAGTTAVLYANAVYLAPDGTLFVRPAQQPLSVTPGGVYTAQQGGTRDGKLYTVSLTVTVNGK